MKRKEVNEVMKRSSRRKKRRNEKRRKQMKKSNPKQGPHSFSHQMALSSYRSMGNRAGFGDNRIRDDFESGKK